MTHHGTHHQGNIHKAHAPMPKGHGKPDHLASEEYKSANKEHGMHAGLSPAEGYEGCPDEHGGENMGSNCEYDG